MVLFFMKCEQKIWLCESLDFVWRNIHRIHRRALLVQIYMKHCALETQGALQIDYFYKQAIVFLFWHFCSAMLWTRLNVTCRASRGWKLIKNVVVFVFKGINLSATINQSKNYQSKLPFSQVLKPKSKLNLTSNNFWNRKKN